ncbi:MAG: FAD-binding oxidoreductase [Paracoccaceae bacterium]|nr:FAD-binding oxidoreductase [Paracoccaceae bacterium]
MSDLNGGQPVSLWAGTAEEKDVSSPFESGGPVDVAIVGGGYTGLSTALHAAEHGLSVHVIEAEHVGYGGSGRSVGFVNAGTWHPPGYVRKRLGPVFGPRFLERFSEAPATVFDIIERHQIRCSATRTGTLHVAHSPAGLRNLEVRHAEWKRLGAPVELLNRDAVRELAGTGAFFGGLLDRRAGTINPMGYCRGLARAAQMTGARISTGVRVEVLRRDAGFWRVETRQGTVTANSVVLATNAYTDGLWPGLGQVYVPIHYLQFSTPPLGEEADHILPGRQGLWDTGKVMASIRRDAAGRLQIGTMGRVIGSSEDGLTWRWAQRRLRSLFPELGELRFETAWDGRIALTPDHVPRIHQLAEELWTAIGYNGRGITTGTVFGQAMAELLCGSDPAGLPLPVTGIATVPNRALKAWLYDIAFSAKQFWP